LLAIGLAYALQEVERVPAGVDDEPLDLVVTEDAVHDVVASARHRRSAP
jgi:5-formyltetrahydrofolate cyclo-ligase